MPTALAFVHYHAQTALATKPLDDQLFRLAAHLFALACVIPTECGSARLHETHPRQPDSVEDELQRLKALAKDTTSPVTPPVLFWNLVVTLQSIEDRLTGLVLPGGVFSAITLNRTLLKDWPGLHIHGEVVHWLRPYSRWRTLQLRRQQEDENGVGSGPPAAAPHPAASLARLALHWNADPRQPRVVPPRPWSINGSPWLGDRLLDGQPFRIALCPLPKECHPHFVLSEGRFFHAKNERSIQKEKKLEAHLAVLFEAAREEQIHFLAFPELMGDARVEGYVLTRFEEQNNQWPWAVLAGSFHRWSNGIQAKSQLPANRAVLWSRPGRPVHNVLQHEKRGKFRITRRQYELAREVFFPDEPKELIPEIEELVESIVHGAELHVLDTTLGRFAVVICADCITPDYTILVPLIKELRPDFLFIVSMTPETKLFEAVMEDLARSQIASFFINSACMCASGNLLASVNLSLYEPIGAPATRFRWLEGEEKVEQRFYNPRTKNKEKSQQDWHEPGGEDKGVQLLRHAGKPLALMVDVAHHFSWGPGM